MTKKCIERCKLRGSLRQLDLPEFRLDIKYTEIRSFSWFCSDISQCGAEIAERVSALDWLSLRYAAIITLPVSNPGLFPYARHFIILASSVDRDVNGGLVGRN